MSAISNIDDRSLNLVPILNNDKLQRLQTAEREIIRVDKEIGARSQQVNNIKNLIEARENYIASNNELISLYKESSELDKKMIVLLTESKEILQNTNDKLQALLDRGQGRRTVSAEPRLQKRFLEINDLNRKLTYLSKQEAVVKKQTTLVDAKVDKLFMKVDYTEKQLVRLEAQSNGTELSKSQVKQDKTFFAYNYKPTDNQIAKLELSKIKQDVQDIKDMDAVFKQRTVNSQKNIYESIMSKVIADKITKLL